MSNDKGQVKLYLVPVGKTTRVLRVVSNGHRTGAWVNDALAAQIVAAQERLLLSKPMPLWNVEVAGMSASFDGVLHVKEALAEFPQLANDSCVESASAAGLRVEWPKVFLINNGSFGYVLIESGAFRLLTQQELGVLTAHWPELQRAAVDQTFGRQTFVAHSCSRVINVLDFLPALEHEITTLAETEVQMVQPPHVRTMSMRERVAQQERPVAAPTRQGVTTAKRPEDYTSQDVSDLVQAAAAFQALVGSSQGTALPTIPRPEDVKAPDKVEPVKFDDRALAKLGGLEPDGEDSVAGIFGLDQAAVDAIPTARTGQDRWKE